MFLTTLSMISDFFYSSLLRAHLKTISLKKPLFPGQVWVVPFFGEVMIYSVTDKTVHYLPVTNAEMVFSISRKDFVLFCKRPDEIDYFCDDSESDSNVIQLNPRN